MLGVPVFQCQTLYVMESRFGHLNKAEMTLHLLFILPKSVPPAVSGLLHLRGAPSLTGAFLGSGFAYD